jgi:hypothetical protein
MSIMLEAGAPTTDTVAPKAGPVAVQIRYRRAISAVDAPTRLEARNRIRLRDSWRSMVDTACEPFEALSGGVPDAVVEQQERNDVVDMWKQVRQPGGYCLPDGGDEVPGAAGAADDVGLK